MLNLATQINRRINYLKKYHPPKSTRTEAQAARFLKYQQDPEGYAREVLKVTLTNEQAKILRSVCDNRYTLAKASHSVGKTKVAGVAANWWYDCWTEHICYITAPTWSQALGLTFKEVKTVRRECNLSGIILETGWVKDVNKLLEGSHYIRALNSDTGEGFQGEHAAPILIVIEEGVGVPKYIWDAVKGLMTHEDCRVLVIGNPTDDTGDFGQAAESDRYHVISINGLEHPNITAAMKGEHVPFPKAIQLIYVYEMLKDECEQVESLAEDAFEWYALPEIKKALDGQSADLSQRWFYQPNAVFQGRVLGEFPTQADQQVVPKAWLRNLPVLALLDEWVPELGCDPARFGDDRSTIFVRRGPCLLRGREIRKMDADEVASACRDEANEAVKQWKPGLSEADTIALAKRLRIKIDVTGGMGVGPVVLLRGWGYTVVEVNSSSKASDPEQFRNVRSELWWSARMRAKEKRLDTSRLPREIREKLHREWGVPKYKAPGQKIVDPKEEIKKRLGYSPDLADGANLVLYDKVVSGGIEVLGRI